MRHFLRIWLVPVACLSLGIGVIACGDDDDDDNGAGGTGGTLGTGGTGGPGAGGTGGGPGPQTISVSGMMRAHPLSTETLDFESMELRLVDAQAALQDPMAAVLATTDVESDGSFQFSDVDISDAGVGIVLTAEGGDDVVTSSMGLCMFNAVDPVLECGDRSDFVGYAVPTTLADTLATNLSDADLVTKGLVLGMTVDGMQNPLPAVEITTSAGDVVALDSALGPTGSNVTSEIGAFVVTGQPGLVNLAPEQTGTTFVPSSQPVGISPGVVFQVFFVGSDDAGTGGSGGGAGGGTGGTGGGTGGTGGGTGGTGGGTGGTGGDPV